MNEAREFDFANIDAIEFGMCVDIDGVEAVNKISVDQPIKDALSQMLHDTIDQIRSGEQNNGIIQYEPAEKYSSDDKLILPLDSEYAFNVRELYNTAFLPLGTQGVDNPESLVYYFGRWTDNNGNRVIAVKRSSYFKGILSYRGKLIRLVRDTMQLIDDNVFKLDKDFDFVVINNNVLINRYSGFEFTASIDAIISQRAVENTHHLSQEINFINFSSLANYVASHKRAARLIASIRSRHDLQATSRNLLILRCRECGIELLDEASPLLEPVPGAELAFLMLLDRRRYTVSLIDQVDELYEASSRRVV